METLLFFSLIFLLARTFVMDLTDQDLIISLMLTFLIIVILL